MEHTLITFLRTLTPFRKILTHFFFPVNDDDDARICRRHLESRQVASRARAFSNLSTLRKWTPKNPKLENITIAKIITKLR